MRGKAMMKQGILATVVGLALVLTILTGPVLANGAPVRIELSYLPGLSNWGPTDAWGIAVVVLSEEEVDVEVRGLPRLSDERYTVWLGNTTAGGWFLVGQFNVDSRGDGLLHQDIELPAGLPDHPFDQLVISVESTGARPVAPGTKVSLAGYFPGTRYAPTPTPTATTVGRYPTPAPPSPTGVPTGTVAAAGAISVGTPDMTGTPGMVPSRLPNTGGPAPALSILALGGLLLMVGAAARVVVAGRSRE